MTLFNSHIQKLRIVLTPAKPVFEAGVRVGDTPGKYAQFVGGRFQTNDEKVIKKLESLKTFGVDFYRVSDEEPAQEPEKQPEQPNLESLTRPELVALAKERNIEVDDKLSPEEIRELLKGK